MRAFLLILPLVLAACDGSWDDDDTRPGMGDDDDDDFTEGEVHDDVEPGALILDGLIVDVTPAGIDAIETMAEEMGPVPIPMDPISAELGEMEGCDWSVQVTNLTVGVDFVDLSVQPISHGVDIDADTLVQVNDATNPFDLFLDADGGVFDSCNLLDMHCDLWVDPMEVSLGMEMWLEVTDPGGSAQSYMDAIVSTPEHNLMTAFTSDKIQLSGCLIATINDVLNFFGTDLIGTMIDEQVGDLFSSLETELPGQIETAVEEGFQSASVDESLDVNGALLDIYLEPRNVMLEPDGIRVLMNGAFDAEPAACIAEFDPGSFAYQESPWPALDPGASHHAAAYLADDLITAAMYAAWRGGVLCATLDPAELGFPLDSSFLGLMLGEGHRPYMERIWLDEPQPMAIATVPRAIPELIIDGEYDLEFDAPQMELGFFALTQDRMARIFAVEVDVAAGVDVTAVGDGSLALDVAVDTADMAPVLTETEFVPWYAEEIEANFSEIVLGVLDTALGPLLEDLVVGPLDFGGIGLTSLELAPAGPTEAFLGATLEMGVVDPAASCDLGCGGGEEGCAAGEEGCSGDEGSCAGTCSQARRRTAWSATGANLALFGVCLAALVVQRRRYA